MSSLSAAIDPSLVTVARVRLVADNFGTYPTVSWVRPQLPCRCVSQQDTRTLAEALTAGKGAFSVGLATTMTLLEILLREGEIGC